MEVCRNRVCRNRGRVMPDVTYVDAAIRRNDRARKVFGAVMEETMDHKTMMYFMPHFLSRLADYLDEEYQRGYDEGSVDAQEITKMAGLEGGALG